MTTPMSGAIKGMKGDVVFRSMRLECKRTDKDYITFDKKWIEKLERETAMDEFFAVEMEFLDRRMYVITEELFRFLEWHLSTPIEEVIRTLQDGER